MTGLALLRYLWRRRPLDDADVGEGLVLMSHASITGRSLKRAPMCKEMGLGGTNLGLFVAIVTALK